MLSMKDDTKTSGKTNRIRIPELVNPTVRAGITSAVYEQHYDEAPMEYMRLTSWQRFTRNTLDPLLYSAWTFIKYTSVLVFVVVVVGLALFVGALYVKNSASNLIVIALFEDIKKSSSIIAVIETMARYWSQ
jgi:hypothetical protein